MYFEGREVTPYQDPIMANELKEGGVYYIVGSDNNIPIINSVYFIGINLERDDQRNESICYFQDSTSYFAGVRYGDIASKYDLPAMFLRQPASNLNGIYDFEASLQILMHYFLKQQKAQS